MRKECPSRDPSQEGENVALEKYHASCQECPSRENVDGFSTLIMIGS